MSKSFGLMFALCLLILVIATGLSIVYESLMEEAAEKEESIKYPKGENITETVLEQTTEGEKEFRWLGHTISNRNTISIQVQYIGPTIKSFDEKKVDFYINGKQCKWQGLLTKEKSGKVSQLNDGERIYMLIVFECTISRGDILTMVYTPLDLEISAQI